MTTEPTTKPKRKRRSTAPPRLPKPMTAEEFSDWVMRHGWSMPRLALRTGILERQLYRFRSGASAIQQVDQRALAWALDNTKKDQRRG